MPIDQLAAGARAASGGFQIAESIAAKIGKFRRDRRQLRRATELLGVSSEALFNYRVAMQHPLQLPGTPHPDDAYAFVSVASEAACRAMEKQNFTVAESIPTSLDDGFVLIGSPEAELLTSLAFGYEKKDDGSGMRFTGSVLDLPYRWQEDLAHVSAKCTRIVPGKGEVTRPNWPIIDNTGIRSRSIYPVIQNDGKLHSDLLLITRVPNFFSDIALQSGRTIVSIAGTHGTGTRAIEVLLRDKNALRKIADEIPHGTESFQILLEVGNIQHSIVNGSVATSIVVRDVQCFDRPSWTWDRARNSVEEGVKKHDRFA